jgi:hypothetical protein
MHKLLPIALLSVLYCSGSPAAPTCDQFKTAIAEAAKLYHSPEPKFQLAHVSSLDPDKTFWSIAAFDDVRSMMECRRGRVGTFAADTNNSEVSHSLHLLAMMGMGLHGYGMEWRPALVLRNNLLRKVETSHPHTAEIPIDETSLASLSLAGVPTFKIDTAEVQK